MRPLALLAFALLACTACSVERRGDDSRAAPDSSDQAHMAAASPPAAAVPAPITPTGPDAEARAACAAAAAAWRAIPSATLRELDTLLTMHDVIEDPVLDSAPPPGAVAGRWAACAVEGYAEAGLDSTRQHPLYWPAVGWVVFPRLTADGPGAQVQVYQRGWIRCQVAEESDGGDDGDSTYVPTPFHRERTLCWHHGRLVAPQDTISLGG